MRTPWLLSAALIGVTTIMAVGVDAAQGEMLPPVHCAIAAITCVAIDGSATQIQHDVPITFGQPFAAGDVPHGATLAATDGEGKNIPLQVDGISSHADGSVRYAILTANLPLLKKNDTISLALRKSGGAISAAAPSATGSPAADYDLTIDVILRTPQITQIVFGNRDGATPGLPFREGESVTVNLGDNPADRYTVPIGHDMAGGDYTTLTLVAQAMTLAINKGERFRAYKIGEGGGYENLWVTTRDPPGRSFAVTFSYAGRGKLTTRVLQAWAPARHYTASVRSALTKAAAKPTFWLKGAVATEATLVAPLRDVETQKPHPQLTARFNLRYYAAGQRVRTDVVLENDWAYEPAPGNTAFDIAITAKDAIPFKAVGVGLYQHARWHKIIWSGAVPIAALRYDVPYFVKSRIVSNYDTAIHIPELVLANEARRLAAADTGPMGSAFIAPYMPTTGGREDIAPLPRWTVLYLLSQDSRARAAMLANADASGGIPIHYRDRPTDQPVSIDLHPGIALFLGVPRGADALPAMLNGDTVWTPDAAHQPSLAYIPYLITGDRFYLDELLFWANWDMGGIDSGYREGARGLVNMNQIRGQAWSLRTLGEAAMATPDDHPMKAYFTQKLRNNLQWYVDHYPRNRDHERVSPLGWVERPDVPGSTPPWQGDFLALVTGHLAEAGFPLAEEFFRWQAQSTVGRWTHEADGYCWTVAPGYYITVRSKAGEPIRDWRSLFHANWPDLHACPARFPEDSYPDSPIGSVAIASAMLAISADFHIPGARAAFDRLRTETHALVKAQWDDPSWAIAPRIQNFEKAEKP